MNPKQTRALSATPDAPRGKPDNNRDASNIVDFTTRENDVALLEEYSPTAFECKHERAAAFLPTSGHDSHSANQTASGSPCSRLRVRFDVLSTYPDLSLGALYERRIRDVRMTRVRGQESSSIFSGRGGNR